MTFWGGDGDSEKSCEYWEGHVSETNQKYYDDVNEGKFQKFRSLLLGHDNSRWSFLEGSQWVKWNIHFDNEQDTI